MTRAEERASDDDAFEAVIAAASHDQRIAARDMRVTGGALARMVAGAPLRGGRHVLQRVSFGGITFVGTVDFSNVVFEGGASFGYSIFEGNAVFDDSTFAGPANFTGASFEGGASFARTTFRDDAEFQDTTWRNGGYFGSASFERDASFQGPTVFHADARFDLAKFGGQVRTPNTCGAELWFDRAQFESARHLGALTACGRVILDGAVFSERVTVVVRAPALSAARTEFRAGADILVQSAIVSLDGAEFGADSTLSSATPDTVWGALLPASDYDKQTIPRVVSLIGAHVANLALSGVDLRGCRFRGAHGLDGLRLEQVVFAETPRHRQTWGRWPFRIRWTRRLAVAEEHRWRSQLENATGWWAEELQVRPETPNWREARYADAPSGRRGVPRPPQGAGESQRRAGRRRLLLRRDGDAPQYSSRQGR